MLVRKIAAIFLPNIFLPITALPDHQYWPESDGVVIIAPVSDLRAAIVIHKHWASEPKTGCKSGWLDFKRLRRQSQWQHRCVEFTEGTDDVSLSVGYDFVRLIQERALPAL